MLEKLGRQYQVGVFPNIVREYFQHIFLGELYRLPDAGKILFSAFNFSLIGVMRKETKLFIEGLFVNVLSEIERTGIKVELGDKVGDTRGGYLGIATFRVPEYPPVSVEINVSTRNEKRAVGEVD